MIHADMIKYAKLESYNGTSTDFADSSCSFSSLVISAVNLEMSSVGSKGIAMAISAGRLYSVSWGLLSASASSSDL